MFRAMSCEMGSEPCNKGFSTIAWTLAFCFAGRESDPMKRIGGLIAWAAIRGLLWTSLSVAETQKASAIPMEIRSDKRRSVRPMIGTILVNNRVLEIFDELKGRLYSYTDEDLKIV
jgi:hypothetical protein